MNTSFIVLLIIQLVLLIFSACIMYLILSSKYLHDLDKRFLSYTITNNKNIESSFFDKFYPT